MEAIFQFVDEVVKAQRDTYCAIADDIWDHPETRFEEFWSAQRLADALEAEGFQLTRDAGGIPNAFIASVGEGQPVIALLGEFDALAGLAAGPQRGTDALDTGSQRPRLWARSARHRGIRRGGRRQRLAAAARRQRHSALLRLSGEEGGSGKTFMVREGLLMMSMRR